MPRGKRAAGEGGARGRYNKKTGKYKIGDQEVEFDADLNVDSGVQPEPLFPEYKFLAPTALTPKEINQVTRFRALRSAIHEGPYYSVLGDDVRVGKGRKNVDPFQGVPTWSQKYMRQRRTLPRFKDRPHVLRFFPRELWGTLNKRYENKGGSEVSAEAKKAGMAKRKASEAVANGDGKGLVDDEEPDDVVKEVDDNDEDEMEDEVVDDEFDEDDDEGGDYNAEAYFDDGGEDAGDVGGDDGDGGGDYF